MSEETAGELSTFARITGAHYDDVLSCFLEIRKRIVEDSPGDPEPDAMALWCLRNTTRCGKVPFE